MKQYYAMQFRRYQKLKKKPNMLWEDSVNSDRQKFKHYQQNE